MRFWYISLLIIVSFLFLSGCKTVEIVCQSPGVMINETCCIDSDNNSICDIYDKKEVVEKKVVEKQTNKTSVETKTTVEVVEKKPVEVIKVEPVVVIKSLKQLVKECEEIKDSKENLKCLSDVAILKNSGEPCLEAEYERYQFTCMGIVAAKRQSSFECEKLVELSGFGGTRLQKAYCVLEYVKQTMNKTACREIDRRKDVVIGAMYEECMKLEILS